MTPETYQLWLSVYNAGINSGPQSQQALQAAEEAAESLEEFHYYGA